MSQHHHDRKWWKEATIYQIYPSSFASTNVSGTGNIPGIISKLPHLVSLGVNTLWLSPHYKSPQVDMGYDISDFEDIHAPYGTLADCQNLIEACHAYRIKIIFDLVINHTSDQHEWFQESRSSKTNSKRDWYFWRAPNGFTSKGEPMPPNNWRSQFTVPAWNFDPHSQEYYLHIYAPEMPDLNWENQTCRRAIYASAIEFWLKRGIDGFRIDIVNKYSKDTSFPDAEITDPTQYTQPAMKHYSNGPRMHEFLAEMKAVFDKYRTFDGQPIMTVGELPNTPDAANVRAYVSAAAQRLDMVFNFDAIQLGQTAGNRLVPKPFSHGDFKREMARWQTFVNDSDAWTTVFLENHDQGRSISRFGCDKTEELRVRSGKMLAVLLATMTGTLFLYQGQEIGMVNMPRSWGVEEYKDIRSVNFYRQLVESGASEKALSAALDGMQRVARDHARTPVQWSDEANAGFCPPGGIPWMRVNDNYKEINVEKEGKGGLLEWWKEMIKLRTGKWKDLWVYGSFEALELPQEQEQLFVFAKTGEDGGKSWTVVNLGGGKVGWKVAGLGVKEEDVELLVCNFEKPEIDALVGYEARVYVSEA